MARRYRSTNPQPKVPAALRPAALLRYFKVSGRLMFNEVDGDLWVTDSYMAAKVPEKSPLLDWLALYNLTPEPMVCSVNGTVQRTDAQGPDIAKLVAKYGKGHSKFPKAERMTFGSAPLYIDAADSGKVYEVWEGGERFYVDPRVRAAAETIAGPGDWKKTPNKNDPVLLISARKLIAMVMPVRAPGAL